MNRYMAWMPATKSSAAPLDPASGNVSFFPGRLMSLDIYRGLMVAGMIIVDNPGSDDLAY
jgi:predicted acyltransferase